MRAQNQTVKLSEHELPRRIRSKRPCRVIVSTHVNKGKQYPYGSKRQGYASK